MLVDDCIDLDNGDISAEFRCLRGLQEDNYYSTKMYQYFVNHTDGPDNAIRLLKADLNSLICLLEIDKASL